MITVAFDGLREDAEEMTDMVKGDGGFGKNTKLFEAMKSVWGILSTRRRNGHCLHLPRAVRR